MCAEPEDWGNVSTIIAVMYFSVKAIFSALFILDFQTGYVNVFIYVGTYVLHYLSHA